MMSLERIDREVAALGDLPREELIARWIKVYGCPPPKGVKHGLLARAAAWHLQARHLGGLSPTARRAIRDATKLSGKAEQGRGDAPAIQRPKNPKLGKLADVIVVKPSLRPGTRLMREWNGRVHAVDVSEDGFVFDGKTYRSLTAIARRITGAHWSGPRFFGI
jgi:hypothetical protein